MSDRMPPSPPRPPKFPGSGRPESPNWGVWVMVLLIVGVLAFGFFTPESFGLGPRKENLESFEAQYKAGRVVLNDPKAPVEVVLSENGSEGVIHALVYRKEIQPKVEMTPFALTYSMSLPDRDKPLLNELSGYRVVESPYRTEEGKMFPSFLRELRSFPFLNSTAWPWKAALPEERTASSWRKTATRMCWSDRLSPASGPRLRETPPWTNSVLNAWKCLLPWSSRETASSSCWGRIRSSSVNPVPGAASC